MSQCIISGAHYGEQISVCVPTQMKGSQLKEKVLKACNEAVPNSVCFKSAKLILKGKTVEGDRVFALKGKEKIMIFSGVKQSAVENQEAVGVEIQKNEEEVEKRKKEVANAMEAHLGWFQQSEDLLLRISSCVVRRLSAFIPQSGTDFDRDYPRLYLVGQFEGPHNYFSIAIVDGVLAMVSLEGMSEGSFYGKKFYQVNDHDVKRGISYRKLAHMMENINLDTAVFFSVIHPLVEDAKFFQKMVSGSERFFLERNPMWGL